MSKAVIPTAILLIACGCSREEPKTPTALFPTEGIEFRRSSETPRPGFKEKVHKRTGEKTYVDEQPGILGEDIRDAKVSIETFNGEPEVYLYLVFTLRGREKMRRFTQEQFLKQVAILINGELRSTPQIRDITESGSIMITGAVSLEEAQRLLQLEKK